MMKKTLQVSLLAAAMLGLSACAPLVTQSPGMGLSPVNAVADGEDRHVMLFGADVVSYFTENTYRPGSPAIKSVYKGVTFRFSKPAHKAMFDREPEKYLPQYGGYCANGIVYGIPYGGNADAWRMINGKLYTFGGPRSVEGFMLDVPKNVALADRYWAEEVSGSNAFVQRVRRLVDRVPHYRTGAQLNEDIARAKGK
jgi:YHS domain-containing protein